MSSLRNQPNAEDQRNVIIATILVAVILFAWMFYFGPTPAERAGVSPDSTQQTTQSTPNDATAQRDTQRSAQPQPSPDASDAGATANADPDAQQASDDVPSAPPSDPITGAASQGTEREIVVETDLYTAVLTNKGGSLKRFTLKDYKEYNQQDQIQLIDTTRTRGAVGLAFTTPTSRLIDSRSLYFTPSTESDTIRVGDEEQTLTFEAQLGDGTLKTVYTFHPDDYDLGFEVQQINASSYQTADGYELIWEGGLPFSEGGKEEELTQSGVFVYSGGSMESLTLQSSDDTERGLNGSISWIALKNKYFTAALMPDEPSNTNGADVLGRKDPSRDGLAQNSLEARLQMPAARGNTQSDTFHFYLGPLYYYQLAEYERDLYQMVDYGWDFFEWLTRPFAVWLFIPMLTYLGGYMPYGVVVILMAVFIKVVVYPLTKKSYRSMAQMRELQPEMEKIKEKYGDDPQKQQEEMMKMYRETGVNPLGGCLPMLLQYPVIIALYQFIPQSIQLRQKSFLWAADLSAPDVILELPFTIPFFGDFVAGFTLLMGLSMVLTMRLQSTPGGGAQAKIFMYVLPVFIFFIFNRFASALSLYYLFYNLVTAAQQKWIYYQLDQEKEEENKRGPRSRGSNGQNGKSEPGFFQKLLKKAEEAQREQQG